MAESEAEICNLALGHLDVGHTIVNLATEKSEEARACRRWYAQCRDYVLGAAMWRFNRKRAVLALVTANPDDEFGFAYAYPSDCVYAWRIPSGTRNDSMQSRVVFEIGSDPDTGAKVILTNKEAAELVYGRLVTDVTRFTPDFIEALAFRLASRIAGEVCSDSAEKYRATCDRGFQIEVSVAIAKSWNEQKPDLPPESESIRSRY